MPCDYRCEKTDMAGQDCKTCPGDSSASDGYHHHFEDIPDICPGCLDKLLTWLDKSEDEITKEIEQLPPENKWMEKDLKEIVNSFRFVNFRIRALR